MEKECLQCIRQFLTNAPGFIYLYKDDIMMIFSIRIGTLILNKNRSITFWSPQPNLSRET